MRLQFLFPLCLLALGCGSRGERAYATAYEAVADIGIIGRGEARKLAFASEKELRLFLATQVERLTGPGWEDAWLRLRQAGRFAIEPLIAVLDDRRPASATVTALPGLISPGDRLFLTRAEVAYALLKEIVGSYSNYKGDLPPLHRKAWEQWWRRNSRRISIRTEVMVAETG